MFAAAAAASIVLGSLTTNAFFLFQCVCLFVCVCSIFCLLPFWLFSMFLILSNGTALTIVMHLFSFVLVINLFYCILSFTSCSAGLILFSVLEIERVKQRACRGWF